MNTPTKLKFSDYPLAEQPGRRIRDLGPQALSNTELLAVATFIGDIETARSLAGLHREYGSLARIPRNKITAIPGIGEKYADALLAIWELGRRESLTAIDERQPVHSPADAAALVQYEMSALEHEELRIALLNTRNQVLRIFTLYKGSANSSQVRVGEVFKAAIAENAVAIIIFHNHPSGDPTPSPDDVALTRALVQAGKLMDVDVLDHLVIGQGRFVSLKERGLGF